MISSLLVGWSPVSVLCVFIVAGVVAGIVTFKVGVVFVVVVVAVVDTVAVVDAEDAITVVLSLLVFFLFRAGPRKVAQLLTMPALRPPAHDHYHHHLVLVIECVGYCLKPPSVQTLGKRVVTVCRAT